MGERKFSIGDRVQVSATYERNPWFRGAVGTIFESSPKGLPLPRGCHWVKFDEPIPNPIYDQPTTGAAVPIVELELIPPSRPTPTEISGA